ncbi:hypothetical protein [Enterovirga sp. CN4-39]|uniref:hypothetical protein n=1 Tax=Enterovirga sp. CN4-39 TaxID=3400910 RepID=UPI003BFCA709
MAHKFQLDQLVRLAHPRVFKGSAASGIYQVTRLMPADETGEFSYRIKGTEPGSGERAVRETEITEAGPAR